MKKLFAYVLSFTIIATSFSSVSAAAKVSDIDGHVAEKEIQYFVDQEIIVGYDDGTFRPNNSVTRAEFARMVNQTFGFRTPAPIAFKDLTTADWCYDDVSYAVAAGFISGYSDNTFRPKNSITREEVASIIQRILKTPLENTYAPKAFNDVALSSHYNPYIGSVTSKGIMVGTSDNMFSPQSFETRADTAFTLYNSLMYGTTENALINGNLIVVESSYGEASSSRAERISGNVIVRSSNSSTKIRNIEVSGDFVVEEPVKKLHLENVEINGKLIVNGGTDVMLVETTVQNLDIKNVREKVAIECSDNSVAYNTNVYTSCQLYEDSDNFENGFSNVVVYGEKDKKISVDLDGHFVAFDVYADSSDINLRKGEITDLYFNTQAENSIASLSRDTYVKTLQVFAKGVKIRGEGEIDTAKIEAPSVTLSARPNEITGSYSPSYSDETETSGVTIIVQNGRDVPVSSAQVTVDGTTKSTNSEGKASFGRLPSGDYDYTIKKSGFTTKTGSFSVDGNTSRTITLAHTNRYSLTFNVTDRNTSSDISGAAVKITNVSSITTSSNGTASFSNLENGVYSYTITKSGYGTVTDTIVIDGSNQTKAVKLTPSASHTVEFRVKNDSNTAISGAKVTFNSTSVNTNSSGIARFTSVPSGTHTYTVSASNYASTSGNVTVSGNITENVVLSTGSHSVTVNVTEGSAPISGATVKVGTKTATTNASGAATVTGLANNTYSVTVTKSNYGDYSDSVVVNGGNKTMNVSLTPLANSVLWVNLIAGNQVDLDSMNVVVDVAENGTDIAPTAASTSLITYSVINGRTYDIDAAVPNGYSATVSPARVLINKATTTVDITISVNP